MMLSCVFAVLFGIIGTAHSAEPQVNCSAPRSPEHGQSFLYHDGRIVKHVCEPGYFLRGKELVRCIDGAWEDPSPVCIEIGTDIDETESSITEPLPPVPPTRPLFSWGGDVEKTQDDEKNETSDDVPLSDEARMHLVLYPRRRIVASRIQTAALRSASELEEEEKKRSKGKNDKKKKSESSTTIHLEGRPSVVYVRKTLAPGKLEEQEEALRRQYEMAALRTRVENTDHGDHIQVITNRRAAVSQDDKGHQAEETLRHMYWMAQHHYPRQASLVEYRSGNPVVVTLTDSQIAWINSLHPELRDQYLRDLYVMRAEEAVEGARAQAFLRRYEDAYNMLYNAPLYARQPVSYVVEDPIASYDYTCHQAHEPFVRAPRLPNTHIVRYDRRQNPNAPHNDYLSAIYRCNPGYIMYDPAHTELHCSKKQWIGVTPLCVPRG